MPPVETKEFLGTQELQGTHLALCTELQQGALPPRQTCVLLLLSTYGNISK